MVAAHDLFVVPRLGQHVRNRRVVAGGFVMEEDEVFHVRQLRELDADDVAGVTLVFFE